MAKNFFEEELLGTKPKKENRLLDNMYAIPKKDKGKNMPRFLPMDKDIAHQVDILYLPEDQGYNYALVVVDVGTGITDAEPVDELNSKAVLKAIKNIYQRDILDEPKVIQVDNGKEFQDEFRKYFEKQKIGFRKSKPYRHRQQGLVEARNKTIGKLLLKRQAAEEVQTGKVSTEWVDDLPELIKAINKKAKLKPRKNPSETLQCEGDSCNILPIGTKVRVALEAPRNVATGRREHGKFRASDPRWEVEVRKIEQVLIAPRSPPMYLVSSLEKGKKYERTAYTKNQLQVVKEDEKAPNRELIYQNQESRVPRRILSKKKIGRTLHYEVEWLDGDKTMEPMVQFRKDRPDLVNLYENSVVN